MSVCTEAGCPELVESGRCTKHRRERDKARGTRQQRGYDAAYDAQHAAYMRQLAAGVVLTCWRCKTVVLPHEFSLGHCDDDRTIIHGPEHLRRCNLANTRGGCPHASHGGGG